MSVATYPQQIQLAIRGIWYHRLSCPATLLLKLTAYSWISYYLYLSFSPNIDLGLVTQSMVGSTHWLRSIKTNTFLR